MELQVTQREVEKKSQVKELRRNGAIPAVIYHRSKPAEAVSIDATAFATFLRKVVPGRLSTTIFTLSSQGVKARKAILKDIQYNPVNYAVIHLDFEELIDDVPVNIKVPVECVGMADCPGIKLGGNLRQVSRHVRVSSLPKDIPTHFELDVKQMNIRDSKKVKDIAIPNTLRPLVNMNEVIVVIAKR